MIMSINAENYSNKNSILTKILSKTIKVSSKYDQVKFENCLDII